LRWLSGAIPRVSIKLKWFQLYLRGRTQHVRLGLTKSSIVCLLCGAPQGSVLGPILFALYTADLVRLIEQHGLHGHLFADDTQVMGSCQPRDINALQSRMSISLDDVAAWMRSNRLQLNTSKTELLWCATAHRQISYRAPLFVLDLTWSILRPQFVT